MNTDQTHTIVPQSLEFSRDTWGQFRAKWPAQTEPIAVEPVRAFPLTFPREQISLLNSEGQEVVLIASLEQLPTPQRELLESELREREFSPEIRRIVHVSASAPPCQWDVETDHGRVTFTLDSEDDLRRLPNGSFVIADKHGIRYLIPAPAQLDPSSRAFLRRFH